MVSEPEEDTRARGGERQVEQQHRDGSGVIAGHNRRDGHGLGGSEIMLQVFRTYMDGFLNFWSALGIAGEHSQGLCAAGPKPAQS